jgi:F-type H+-transporting ATPase subunit a
MIPLGSETLFTLFGFRITNTITGTLVTDAVLFAVVFLVYKGIALRPGKLQNIFEIIIDYFYSVTKEIAGTRAASIFPWFASFFFFILFANFLGLIPGYGLPSIRVGEEYIPLLRVPSSDFNTTFALAVISLLATHVLSVRYLGVKNYLKHFFSLSPILLFVGFLELVSELTKLISFSFRLFGNIFAGEVVLSRASSLVSVFLVPIPFVALEMIVAVVQALVFAMLTMIFMSILTEPHAEGGEHT